MLLKIPGPMLEISIEATKSAKKKRESQLNVHFSIYVLWGKFAAAQILFMWISDIIVIERCFLHLNTTRRQI